MRYFIVNPRKMRPTMKLTEAELDRLFTSDEPPTVRRPELAENWARRMNDVAEFKQSD